MFVEINGHLLNTVSFGAGPRTLLAQGGWIGNWELWQQPFELLGPDWRTVAFDHRGAGESVVPPDDITAEGLADDIFGVMEALGIDRCILAGESAGATVAVLAALRHPERFDGLILVDGAPGWDSPGAHGLAAGLRADFDSTIRAFIDRAIPEAGADHIRRWGRDILHRAEPEAAARLLECMYPVNVTARLAELSVPVLLMHGTADAIVPPEASRMMASRIAGSTLISIEGAGHVPTLTRPDLVAQAIEEAFPREQF